MREKHFLLFLALLSLSPFALADSFYAGAQAGADFFAVNKEIRSVAREVTPPIPRPSLFDDLFAQEKNAGTGGVGGIFLGYSWQFQDVSLGLEGFLFGDGSSSTQKIRNAENNALLNFSATEKMQGYYGVALKPGYLLNEKAKLYAKVGWAQGRFNISGTEAGTIGITTPKNISQWVNGWQLGLGSELFVSPNLAFTLEYNHIQFSKKTLSSISKALSNPDVTQETTVQYRPQSNNVLFGLTYYFQEAGNGGNGFATADKDDGGYDA